MTHALYILCGKVASGKSLVANLLSQRGIETLCVDQMALERIQSHRDPLNYYQVAEEEILRQAEAAAKADIRDLTIGRLARGESVGLDDGFWSREFRMSYCQLARNFDAVPIIIYCPVDESIQWQRLQRRNKGDLTHTHYISEATMRYLNQFFEEPKGEEVVTIKPDIDLNEQVSMIVQQAAEQGGQPDAFGAGCI